MTANPVAELNFSGRGMNFVSNRSNYRGTIKSDCAPKAREFFWGCFWGVLGDFRKFRYGGGGGVRCTRWIKTLEPEIWRNNAVCFRSTLEEN